MTLYVPNHFGRVSSSFLSTLELNEWIAYTPEHYVEQVVQLAQDPEKLRNLRSTLRERMKESGICNRPKYIRSLEKLYRQMWQEWCKNNNDS